MTRVVRHGRKRRCSVQLGYTLVEVMISIGVMTVGAMGVVALQQATTAGTRQGREISTAVNQTETWLDRVREDALRWRVAGPLGLAATNYLSNAPAAVATPGVWFTPVPLMAGRSFASDFLGTDTNVAGAMVFCTHMQLNWIAGQTALRVDVRTWWHRTGGSDIAAVNLTLFGGCAVGNEAAVTAELAAPTSRLHAVYGSTVVRWNRP